MNVEKPGVSPHLACLEFLVAGATAGERILDVGCGNGELLSMLAGLGCDVVGLEIDEAAIDVCRQQGLDVRHGFAEALPFSDASFDRITCSVVLPYTDEKKAVAEWERVLKPGGHVTATAHGIGYGLDYVRRGPGFRTRVYGVRMLVNTGYYGIMGKRLPGFLGDTLCQRSRRLRSYYRTVGLSLEKELAVGTVAGSPRFLCHGLVKQLR